jgi:hypothetical protein
MSGVVLITVEGVLSNGDDLRNSQPTKQARQLYDGLRSQNNVIILTRATEEIARWWLKREYLLNWSTVKSYPPTSAFTYDQWRIDQLREMLAVGFEVFAFVDASPAVVEDAVKIGVLGFTVSYPHMPVGWREVGAPRSWSSVAATVDAQP